MASIFTGYTGAVLQIQLLKCAFGWQYSFMYWPYRGKKMAMENSSVAFDNVSICYPCQSHSWNIWVTTVSADAQSSACAQLKLNSWPKWWMWHFRVTEYILRDMLTWASKKQCQYIILTFISLWELSFCFIVELLSYYGIAREDSASVARYKEPVTKSLIFSKDSQICRLKPTYQLLA